MFIWRIEETESQAHLMLVVNVAVNPIFYSWIFGFRGKVKIKSPEIIRRTYNEMIINEYENIDI